MFDVLGYVFIALLLLNALILIGMVGEPRKPLSGGVAAFSVFINAVLAWVVYGLIQGW